MKRVHYPNILQWYYYLSKINAVRHLKNKSKQQHRVGIVSFTATTRHSAATMRRASKRISSRLALTVERSRWQQPTKTRKRWKKIWSFVRRRRPTDWTDNRPSTSNQPNQSKLTPSMVSSLSASFIPRRLALQSTFANIFLRFLCLLFLVFLAPLKRSEGSN